MNEWQVVEPKDKELWSKSARGGLSPGADGHGDERHLQGQKQSGVAVPRGVAEWGNGCNYSDPGVSVEEKGRGNQQDPKCCVTPNYYFDRI